MTNKLYHVERLTNTPTHRLYHVDYSAKTSRLRRTDITVLCREENTESHSVEGVYEIVRGRFHASEVNEGETAVTLLLTQEHSATKPLVIGALDGAAEYWYDRRDCDDLERSTILAEVRRAVGS